MEQVGFWVSEQDEATNLVLPCFFITATSYGLASHVTQKAHFSQQANMCFYKSYH